MRFLTLPEHNLTLVAPPDWDAERNGPCESVTCLREIDGFTVAMELEQAEVAALLNGGCLKVKIFGQGFPPMAVFVGPKT